VREVQKLPVPGPLQDHPRDTVSPEELRRALWQWLDQIPGELQAGGQAPTFASWLRALGRHERYSAFNRSLIAMQAPRTPAVGIPGYWKAQGRTLFPGAQPIFVLAYEDGEWRPQEVYPLEETEGAPYAADYALEPALVEDFVTSLRVRVRWYPGSERWHFDPEEGVLTLGRAMLPEDALEVALVANELVLRGNTDPESKVVAVAAASAFMVRFGVDWTRTPEAPRKLHAFRRHFENPRQWRQQRKAIEAALQQMEAFYQSFLVDHEEV